MSSTSIGNVLHHILHIGRLVLLSGLAVSAALPAQQPAPLVTPPRLATAAAPLAIRGVTVIDVQAGRHLPNRTVVIVGRRIRTITSSTARLPRGARVVAGRGKYLIPGFWDMHIHDYLWCAPDAEYRLFIANGVTGIRDMGSPYPLDTLLHWRQEIGAGQRVGPRMVVAGPMLGSGGPPPAADSVGAPPPPPPPDSGFCNYPSPAVSVASPADARRVVDSLRAAGADFIKIHGVVDSATYFAVAAETRRLKMPFGGHPDMDPLVGSDSGQRSIEHANSLPACVGDSARVETCQPVAARFRRNGTWFVPTFAVGRSPRSYTLAALRLTPGWVVPESLYAKTAAQLAGLPGRRGAVPPGVRIDIAQQAGLPILTGTDAPVVAVMPGLGLHDELADLVWAGMTPLGALQAATLNPAQYLKATDSLGTVAPGKLADLVLLDANPLADIDNTTRIRAVVANGRYYDRAALDQLIAAARRPTRVLRTLP